MDYKNQLSIFNPSEFENTSITVVGVGAIGSFTTVVLSKMGLKNFVVHDSDTIEEHNVPNQFYKLTQLGKKKTEALKDIVTEFSESNIRQKSNFQSEDILTTDIVIVCTDNMKSRALVYNKAKESVARWFIDARMNGHTYRVYTVDLNDENEKAEFEKNLYGDDVSDEGPCTEKTIIYNVVEIASKISSQVRKILNNQKHPNMIAYDFMNDVFIKKYWLSSTHTRVENTSEVEQ